MNFLQQNLHKVHLISAKNKTPTPYKFLYLYSTTVVVAKEEMLNILFNNLDHFFFNSLFTHIFKSYKSLIFLSEQIFCYKIYMQKMYYFNLINYMNEFFAIKFACKDYY